ncbi:hypothetical protein G7Y89_g15196 [Cudoniella acicularis]|uniref:Chromatin modification-related protein EAF6 n=1 Tax=Cudoniella acicularis TaxID=354080 RepID=A0A8H4QSL6_9HELO|nr:hypothetical protein G7Y89_g15196 [Cudoniella acicularis]
MASSVDAKLLKSTKFPPEFNQKVDMQKVNAEVMKKWIASKISEILGSEDDVVIELCFNLIEGTRYPDIKKMQIQLTGFLDKDTANFCKELWKLCLSAQSNPQGVPKELLEAKKLELIQEKIEAEKAAEVARKRRDEDQKREQELDTIRTRERGERGRGGGAMGGRGDSWRGGRGGRGDDRNRDYDRGPPRDFDRRGPRFSRSPPRRRNDSRDRGSFRGPPLREADTYVPRGRGGPRRDGRRNDRRRSSLSNSPAPGRSPSRSRSRSRTRSPPRRRYRSSSRSRSPPPRRRRSRSRSPDRRDSYRGRGARGRGRSPDRGTRRRRSTTPSDSSSRSPRPIKRRRVTSTSISSSPPPRRTRIRRNSSSRSRSRSRIRARSVSTSRSISPTPARKLSRTPSRTTSRSREPTEPRKTSPTPDDDAENRIRARRGREERRLTRSYSRSITPPRRRRRSRSRTASRNRRERKRRRSLRRYEANKRRRNTSSVSSPVDTRNKRADTEVASDRGSPRPETDSKNDGSTVPEEKKDPQKQASELREKLLREKIKKMRTSSTDSVSASANAKETIENYILDIASDKKRLVRALQARRVSPRAKHHLQTHPPPLHNTPPTKTTKMAENTAPVPAPSTQPNNNGADVPGQPFYDRTRQHLKDLLHKKRLLERSLQATEETIYKKETEYLEETPAGNIITGFESYTKGSGNAAPGGGRRRAQVLEGNRVFSRSSLSFGVGGQESPINTAQSTPMAAMAPTPLSTSFVKGDGSSNHPTPTSASSASRTGAGKKNKKNGEDSDGEGRETKKIRTNFGAVRK